MTFYREQPLNRDRVKTMFRHSAQQQPARRLLQFQSTTNRRRRRRGAALVEFAVVLPVFMMVVLGIVEFGRAMMCAQLVTNATREATRLAIVDGTTNSEVESWVGEFLSSSLNVSADLINTSITITPAADNPDPANQLANANTRDLVTVGVQIPFDELTLLPTKFMTGRSMSATSSMRHE